MAGTSAETPAFGNKIVGLSTRKSHAKWSRVCGPPKWMKIGQRYPAAFHIALRPCCYRPLQAREHTPRKDFHPSNDFVIAR